MARPRGDRREQIAAEARRLLEAEGAEALTVRRLAAALGIQAPSLYKHFPDKEALETAVIALGFEEQAAAFEAALAEAADPLAALVGAYRAFALAHPHLYRLMTGRPLRRDLLPAGLERRAAAPVLRVAGDLARARALWGLAHGLVDLEINRRFPPDADLEAAWQAGLVAFAAGPRPHPDRVGG